MKALVAYASRAGSTRGIAEFIGDRLGKQGIQVDILSFADIKDPAGYDAFVIGSAVYQFHWLKEAREFASANRLVLSKRPVWIFSSGPTGPRPTDSKGRDLREVSGPKEIDDLREWLNPRDHKVFFGALYRDRLPGPLGWFARWIPKEEEGDFRNWGEIEAWTNTITEALASLLTVEKKP